MSDQTHTREGLNDRLRALALALVQDDTPGPEGLAGIISDMEKVLDAIDSLNGTSAETGMENPAAEIAKLKAFKVYVHTRLDEMGIPANPDGPHSQQGCRIGDRLDILEEHMGLSADHRQDVIEWESLMMRLTGEDGIGSVEQAINAMKQELADLRAALTGIVPFVDCDFQNGYAPRPLPYMIAFERMNDTVIKYKLAIEGPTTT